MKPYPDFAAALRPKPQPRIPAFYAVPGKARADGWTPLRQAEFIGHLAETRCVTAAARRAGMGRETAYRLRRRRWSDSLCAAWDAALQATFTGHTASTANTASTKSHTPGAAKVTQGVTLAEWEWRVTSGLWSVILKQGRYAGVRRKADDWALLEWAKASGLTSRRGTQSAPPAEKSQF